MKLTKTFLVGLFVMVFSISFALAAPNGATVESIGTSSSAPNDATAGNDTNALAGNVTEITLSGVSTTQTWQGYFGNVSGAIQLGDSSGNILYNWSLASPEGEVYASPASSITWANIDCATQANQTALETAFNVGATDADGVQETFGLDDHAAFSTGTKSFGLGECNNTKVFNNAGVGTFDEVLLHDGTNAVFAALLQEDTLGFDSATHDFEMLVIEDGHAGDVAVDTYFFWVELQ